MTSTEPHTPGPDPDWAEESSRTIAMLRQRAVDAHRDGVNARAHLVELKKLDDLEVIAELLRRHVAAAVPSSSTRLHLVDALASVERALFLGHHPEEYVARMDAWDGSEELDDPQEDENARSPQDD